MNSSFPEVRAHKTLKSWQEELSQMVDGVQGIFLSSRLPKKPE